MRLTDEEYQSILNNKNRGVKPTPPVPAKKAALVATGEILLPKFKSKAESEYFFMLQQRERAGEVLWFRYEGVTLVLADGVRYTPDYFVLLANRELECHEVKGGYIRPDSMVKLKLARSLFPFRFRLCQKLRTGWEITVVD